MSIVKSFSVGNGDMFYINHGSDNFTVIDCYVHDDNREEIFDEIKEKMKTKSIVRFISTHPDEDHILGLTKYKEEIGISNFYCVENSATKENETEDFDTYCQLRDGDKHFYLYKGCSRKWMNESSPERDCSGINILWPITSNEYYKEALKQASEGNSPNNISPIITYSLKNSATIMWMGDLESDFMENIKNNISLSEIDILFAPHHGRDSGKIPEDMLKKLNPKIIVIGEAPSENLNYYNNYNTITQNSAKDIIFDCADNKAHIYVGNENYKVSFLSDEKQNKFANYIGTLLLS